MTAGEVLDLVRRIHYRTQDFEEGDIEDRILAHSVYELREVPLDQIESSKEGIEMSLLVFDIIVGAKTPICPKCGIHVEEWGADWRCRKCDAPYSRRFYRIDREGVLRLDEDAVRRAQFVDAIWAGAVMPLCPECRVSVELDEERGAWVCPRCQAEYNPRWHYFDEYGVIRRPDWWDTESYMSYQARAASDPTEDTEEVPAAERCQPAAVVMEPTEAEDDGVPF